MLNWESEYIGKSFEIPQGRERHPEKATGGSVTKEGFWRTELSVDFKF